MHIGLVSDTYLPRINGVAISIERFRNILENLGHQVTLFVPGYTGEVGWVNHCYRFPSKSSRNNPEDRATRLHHRESKEIISQIKDLKLDIIHTHTPFELGHYFLKWGREQKIPVVYTNHTWFEAYVDPYARPIPPKIAAWLVRKLSRSFCNKHQLVITPSKSMKEKLVNYGVTTTIQVCPTGLNESEIDIQVKALPEEPYQLLVLSRLSKEKNIEFIVKVFEWLINKNIKAELTIAGDGHDRSRLEKLCKTLEVGQYVRFTGYISGHEKQALLRNADIHLIASKTETQGLAVLEAAGQGTMTIGINQMGVGEMLEQGLGIVASEKVERFGQKIKDVLLDTSYYNDWVLGLREKLKKWKMSNLAERLIAIYQTVIDK